LGTLMKKSPDFRLPELRLPRVSGEDRETAAFPETHRPPSPWGPRRKRSTGGHGLAAAAAPWCGRAAPVPPLAPSHEADHDTLSPRRRADHEDLLRVLARARSPAVRRRRGGQAGTRGD